MLREGGLHCGAGRGRRVAGARGGEAPPTGPSNFVRAGLGAPQRQPPRLPASGRAPPDCARHAQGLHKISTLLKPAWQREHYDTIGELQAAVRSRGGFDGLDVAFFVDCSGSTYFKNECAPAAPAQPRWATT